MPAVSSYRSPTDPTHQVPAWRGALAVAKPLEPVTHLRRGVFLRGHAPHRPAPAFPRRTIIGSALRVGERSFDRQPYLPGLPRFLSSVPPESTRFSGSHVIWPLLLCIAPPRSLLDHRIRSPGLTRCQSREIPKPVTYPAQQIDTLPITRLRLATARCTSAQHPRGAPLHP